MKPAIGAVLCDCTCPFCAFDERNHMNNAHEISDCHVWVDTIAALRDALRQCAEALKTLLDSEKYVQHTRECVCYAHEGGRAALARVRGLGEGQ